MNREDGSSAFCSVTINNQSDCAHRAAKRITNYMALITCNECGAQVSDKAAVCPKCGAPVLYEIKIDKARKEFEKAKLLYGITAVGCIIFAFVFLFLGGFIASIAMSILSVICGILIALNKNKLKKLEGD